MTRRALAAVRSMREGSEANGSSEMTLEEVNDEIAKARNDQDSVIRFALLNSAALPMNLFSEYR